MSPQCQNCGAHVTRDYERVYAPREDEGVRCCPRCPDIVRRGRDVREAKAPRRAGGNEKPGVPGDE